ncbi:DUF1080 domain-containing protein [Arenibacter sp. M-2]|uniref:3-keto-disaccharide hydrolase n=1 Tax=Arenibacter sp. M-2 TaxID=3053612 RepID=UPI0025711CEA|nr:DUF1080 domain-containing protein [Arenibacter sp. M-2]MDL5513006.1 DUF1080 domain-containing protein [Arenibacter sp. M-2]|tara:strand:+ start:3707 stop:4312 length:606 start_codon:yes stop_codon:yes gene_type:complete
MKHAMVLLLFLTFGTSGMSQVLDRTTMYTLFDGKTLESWKIPDGGEWTVKKGKIIAKNNPGKKGSILWTNESYNDFVVQLDFKMIKGNIDSGIFMRGEDKNNPQIQIGVSGSLKRDMTGSPYVPGAGYPVEAKNINRLLRLKGWNTIRARAVNNKYTVWLNGEEVMNYTLDNANLQGPIGIQLHPGREMEIHFKKVVIGKL